jgi:hypothetical protein
MSQGQIRIDPADSDLPEVDRIIKSSKVSRRRGIALFGCAKIETAGAGNITAKFGIEAARKKQPDATAGWWRGLTTPNNARSPQFNSRVV